MKTGKLFTYGTVAVTGHRPNKLWGYDMSHVGYTLLKTKIKAILSERGATRGISGMALGADQCFAEVCISLGIPFTAAVPFVGQEKKWPMSSQTYYHELLDKAFKIVVVCEGSYSPYKMQVRNEWMVDNCELLIAVWEGSSGGTGNCVRYARNIGREIVRIDPTLITNQG